MVFDLSLGSRLLPAPTPASRLPAVTLLQTPVPASWLTPVTLLLLLLSLLVTSLVGGVRPVKGARGGATARPRLELQLGDKY